MNEKAPARVIILDTFQPPSENRWYPSGQRFK